jgi:hypothetical protein
LLCVLLLVISPFLLDFWNHRDDVSDANHRKRLSMRKSFLFVFV